MQPWQWALAALAAYIVGVSKTGIAGLGLLAVALFASALPSRESTGLVLVVLLVGDFIAASVYRDHFCTERLAPLLSAAAVGVVAGFLVMDRINAQMTQRLIGATVVALVTASYVKSNLYTPPLSWPAALPLATGFAAGFTSMVANAAGPLVVLYLLTLRLPKAELMGTTAWCFLLVNLFKLPFSYRLGLINGTSLHASLLLAPFAAAGALSGAYLLRHVSQRTFEALILVLTLLAGLRLLVL